MAIKALIYARISSDKQEDGFSIDAQLEALRKYAQSKGFMVAREFVEVQSAKATGRKQFGEMLKYLRQASDCRVVLVEKTDRLCRNFQDFITMESLTEELGIEVHLYKEGQVIKRESKSQDKLVQGMFLLLARHYIQNLKEEISKGIKMKAEKGEFPGRAPIGYLNDKATHKVAVDPEKSASVTLMFQLFATGEYTLWTLRKAMIEKTGLKISKSHVERTLKRVFYIGLFNWQGVEYKGIHEPLVDIETFKRVQDVISGRNRGHKSRKHEFPFADLLKCKHDGCCVVAEKHKGRYIYYRCTFGRGKCGLPYMPQPKLSEALGVLLKNIEVPEEIATNIANSIDAERSNMETTREKELSSLNKRLSLTRTLMDKSYEDKLLGKVDEGVYERKMHEWRQEEMRLKAMLESASMPLAPSSVLSARRTLELAQKAHSIYLTANDAERAKLLKTVLSNCSTDGVSLWPVYRKPFDTIFERAKNEEWRGRRDSNPRPLP
jgi:site-specific DNA recombinase